jgi:hypothetical protein
MTNSEETWRPVPGYENIYDVSSLGDVRSLDRETSNGRRLKGRPKKAWVQSGGLVVDLWQEGVRKDYTVARLVLEAFEVLSPSKTHTPVHKDGNGLNCRLDNLRWGHGGEHHTLRLLNIIHDLSGTVDELEARLSSK